MRRHTTFGLYLAIISLFIIPLNFLFGVLEDGSLAIFLIIKSYLVTIPVIIIQLTRLGLTNINTTNNNPRLHHSQYILRFIPKTMQTFLTGYFKSTKNQLLSFKIFYILVVLNILEAMLFEAAFDSNDSNPDNNYAWSRYMNVIAGLLCIITMPSPWNNWNNWNNSNNYNCNVCNIKYNLNFWYIDTSNLSKYSDFIMYLANRKEDYYCGICWIILYTLWNVEFGIRFASHKSVLAFIFHLFLPFGMALVIKDPCSQPPIGHATSTHDHDHEMKNVNVIKPNHSTESARDHDGLPGHELKHVAIDSDEIAIESKVCVNNPFYGIWLQSRAFCLWFFLVFIEILREKVFYTSGVRLAPIGAGLTLLVFSTINLMWGTGYFVVWYFYYLPKCKVLINDDEARLDSIANASNVDESKKYNDNC